MSDGRWRLQTQGLSFLADLCTGNVTTSQIRKVPSDFLFFPTFASLPKFYTPHDYLHLPLVAYVLSRQYRLDTTIPQGVEFAVKGKNCHVDDCGRKERWVGSEVCGNSALVLALSRTMADD